MRRVVVDTNVLVSAAIWGGKPRELLLKLLEHDVVISSPQLVAELSDVLARRESLVGNVQTKRFVRDFVQQAEMTKDTARFKLVLDDPDDNVILDAAYSGKADYIVTGDKHLLALKEFKNTQIVTVKQMLNILDET
ncbi:MAG: putative toxin-antitoxin system toxin component, PIN family [Candidatus Bathyarchaeia archaeon]|jgi:putative PIN family toxin of toxin-antitoxin system